MVTLESKLKAFEKVTDNDECDSAVNCRAAHKLGAWAARTMRMSEDQAECFVHNEVFDYLAHRGIGHVAQFVSVKMRESGVHLSDYVLQRQKDRFLKDARIEALQAHHHPASAMK